MDAKTSRVFVHRIFVYLTKFLTVAIQMATLYKLLSRK